MSMTPIGCCRPRRHSCHTFAHLHLHLQEEGSLRTREDNVTHKHTATYQTHTILSTSDQCLGAKPSPWSACRQCTLPMHVVQRSDARATCTKQVEDLLCSNTYLQILGASTSQKSEQTMPTTDVSTLSRTTPPAVFGAQTHKLPCATCERNSRPR